MLIEWLEKVSNKSYFMNTGTDRAARVDAIKIVVAHNGQKDVTQGIIEPQMVI